MTKKHFEFAAAYVRQSDEPMPVRVALALRDLRMFSLFGERFDAERYIDACFAADIANDGRFDYDEHGLYFILDGAGELVSRDASSEEGALFEALNAE